MRPQCCGRNATPFTKRWTHLHDPKYPHLGYSTLQGYRCKACGRLMVPFMERWDGSHMAAMEALREEGMRFDEELNNERKE